MGLVGGPIVLYLIGSIVIQIKTTSNQKQADALQKQHNGDIKKMKAEYEKQRKHFNKKSIKIQKIVARAKKVQACD